MNQVLIAIAPALGPLNDYFPFIPEMPVCSLVRRGLGSTGMRPECFFSYRPARMRGVEKKRTGVLGEEKTGGLNTM